MKMVSIRCRDCGAWPVFAVKFNTSNIKTMQTHIDKHYSVPCGCEAIDWQVTEIKQVSVINVSDNVAASDFALQ